MGLSDGQGIVVLAAGYDSSVTAISDFDAIGVLLDKSHTPEFLDAAVINPQDPDLASRVIRTTASTRHQKGTDSPGLASRIAHYVLEGLALVGGEAGGGDEVQPTDVQRSSPGHVVGSDDLMKLGAVQKASPFTLIVAFSTPLSDLIATTISTTNIYISKVIQTTARELEEQIIRAERRSIPGPNS